MILPILLLAATLLRPVHRRQPDPYLVRIAVSTLDDTSWRESRRRVIRTAEIVDEAMRHLATVKTARQVIASLSQPRGTRPADPRAVWRAMGQHPGVLVGAVAA